jgi:hypothetical protein
VASELTKGQTLVAMDQNSGLVFFDLSTPDEPKRKFYDIRRRNGKVVRVLYHYCLGVRSLLPNHRSRLREEESIRCCGGILHQL